MKPRSNCRTNAFKGDTPGRDNRTGARPSVSTRGRLQSATVRLSSSQPDPKAGQTQAQKGRRSADALHR